MKWNLKIDWLLTLYDIRRDTIPLDVVPYATLCSRGWRLKPKTQDRFISKILEDWQVFDSDGDGTVDFREFWKACQSFETLESKCLFSSCRTVGRISRWGVGYHLVSTRFRNSSSKEHFESVEHSKHCLSSILSRIQILHWLCGSNVAHQDPPVIDLNKSMKSGCSVRRVVE